MPRHLLWAGGPLLQWRMHQRKLQPKQLRRLRQCLPGGRRLLRWKMRPPEYYRALQWLLRRLPPGGDLRERNVPVAAGGTDLVR